MINYIKEKRKSRNLTQQEVADLIKMHRSKYSRIENEYDRALEFIYFDELMKLASLYNLSVDEFVKNYKNALKIKLD